jgi:hypothetical protein
MQKSRWNDERFLRRACDQMAAELDWDSLDSGCLHWAVSRAKTMADEMVIVAVVSHPSTIDDVVNDAQDERRNEMQGARWRGVTGHRLPDDTPLWLYVPTDFELPNDLPSTVVVKRVR